MWHLKVVYTTYTTFNIYRGDCTRIYIYIVQHIQLTTAADCENIKITRMLCCYCNCGQNNDDYLRLDAEAKLRIYSCVVDQKMKQRQKSRNDVIR